MRKTTRRARLAQWHTRFAWRPIRIGGQWIWFEFYRARYIDTGHMWTEMNWQVCMPGDEW